jgi:inhibitor of cysteine peptidase
MFKRYTWLILLPPLLLTGCGGPKLQQIGVEGNNQDYKIPEGTNFQVMLPSNQTTGYKWEINDITTGVLRQIKNEYRVSKKYAENVVGAGGEEIWTFQVLKDERSHIVMEYRRPWDKLEVANKFTITVNGNPGDDGLLTYFGTVHSNPAGSQFDDRFVAEDGNEFGIEPYAIDKIADPGVKARIAEFTDTGKRLEIRGEMVEDVPDFNGKQFLIHEIQEKAK